MLSCFKFSNQYLEYHYSPIYIASILYKYTMSNLEFPINIK